MSTVYPYTPVPDTSGVRKIPIHAWPTQHQLCLTFQLGATCLVKPDNGQKVRLVISQKDGDNSWKQTLSLVQGNPTNLGALFTQPGVYLGELEVCNSVANTWTVICHVQITVQPGAEAITESFRAVGRRVTTAIVAAVAPHVATPDTPWWDRVPPRVLWVGVGLLACLLLAIGTTVWYLIDEQGNEVDAEPVVTTSTEPEEQEEETREDGDTTVTADEPPTEADAEFETSPDAGNAMDFGREEVANYPFATELKPPGAQTQMVGRALLEIVEPPVEAQVDGVTFRAALLNGEVVCHRIPLKEDTTVVSVRLCPESTPAVPIPSK